MSHLISSVPDYLANKLQPSPSQTLASDSRATAPTRRYAVDLHGLGRVIAIVLPILDNS
jgi:hypothetical protein